MTSSDRTIWPPLEEVFAPAGGAAPYRDEFGEIDADVYQTAGELWNGRGREFARARLQDCPSGLRLMVRAAADVTRRRREHEAEIKHLSGYLWTAYRHLVLNELEKENDHRRRDFMNVMESSGQDSTAKDLDRKILVQEVERRMDAFTRKVYQYLLLGFEFSEIGEKLNKNPRALKRRFDRQLARLMKQIEAEHAAAASKSMRRNRRWPFRILSFFAIAVPS
jgi:DNA-directed RNA polymerase specialized sigma24 family protein